MIFIAILSSAGKSEDLYVNVDGQRVLFMEPEKEQWLDVLSSGLDRLMPAENVQDYGLGRYYFEVYDRSLQSHVTNSIYGVLILTNFRLILLQRKRKAAFSQEHEYSRAITIPLPLIRYSDCNEKMLRIGYIKTKHGRKIHNTDFEVESSEIASKLKRQIDELVVQCKSILKMEKRKKKESEIIMLPLRCPKCDGELQPTKIKNVYECKFCGTTVMIKS